MAAAIRAGSTTHGSNPALANHLLFLIDRNGVPSNGKFLELRTARAFIKWLSTDPGVKGHMQLDLLITYGLHTIIHD